MRSYVVLTGRENKSRMFGNRRHALLGCLPAADVVEADPECAALLDQTASVVAYDLAEHLVDRPRGDGETPAAGVGG